MPYIYTEKFVEENPKTVKRLGVEVGDYYNGDNIEELLEKGYIEEEIEYELPDIDNLPF